MINTIYIVSPQGYHHNQALYDIAMAFSYSLKSLGHTADVTIDPSVLNGKTLVFGAHLLPKFEGTIEGDYIIFNTEQLHDGSPWCSVFYLDILKRFEVWDYSRNNIKWLASKGIAAKLCEIGYHPCMSNIRLGKSATGYGGGATAVKVDYKDWGAQAPVAPFDILFYGSMNDRRQKIINDLRAAGKSVVVVNGYGAYRDKYIQQATVVLNMHYYDTAIFEIVRVSHLLANQKCVVSEYGKDIKLENPYFTANGKVPVAFCTYEGLVEMCLKVLSNEILWKNVAREGFEVIKARLQVDILKELVNAP